jgi:O-antigen biosynthesis protein WbqV
VPYLERDWTEAIKTNVFGSINVMDAALAASARAVVTISTDKATYPVSVLGVTKRISELYAQYLDEKQNQTRFIAVRFGNVLASNGSVIPKFRAQIAAGGPVTVTDPRMVRYFMTIREASELVLTAASHSISARMNEFSPKASLYILKMGQPVRILDLAKKLISLAGFEPDIDIPIRFTGIRPGERLNEALFTADEPSVQTGIDGISAATGAAIPEAQLMDGLEQLRLASITHDKVQAEMGFETLVPTYAHRHDPMGHSVPLEKPAA